LRMRSSARRSPPNELVTANAAAHHVVPAGHGAQVRRCRRRHKSMDAVDSAPDEPSATPSIVRTFLKERPSLTLLVGAGISIPAGLPASGHFYRALVSLIATDTRARNELMRLCDAERRDRFGAGDFIRFEALMELLQSRVDPDLEVLRYLDQLSKPAFGHRICAELMAQGHYVFTTNFDILLERACDSVGYPVSPVVTPEEYLAFKPETPGTRLLKLHGTLRRHIDQGWEESRNTIQATLGSLGRSCMPPHIDRAKAPVLRQLVHGRLLLVMGYSAFDDFDISPMLLETAQAVDGVLWVCHSDKEGPARHNTWRDLDQARQRSDPAFVDRHGEFWRRDHAVLHQMGLNAEAGEERSCVVATETRAVLEELRSVYKLSVRPTEPVKTLAIGDFMRDWAGRHLAGRWIGSFLCGCLFSSLARRSEALDCFKTARRLACDAQETQWVAQCSHEIGDCLADMAQYADAESHYRRAKELLSGDAVATAKLDYSLARLYRRWHAHYGKALRFCRASLKVFTQTGDTLAASGCHQELAIILHRKKDFPSAFLHAAENARLSRLLGNMGNFANGLGEMATVRRKRGCRERGDYCKALKLQDRCHDLFRQLGMRHHVATSLANIGLTHQESGDYQGAGEYYQRALHAYERLNDSRGVARTINQLGIVASHKGECKRALKLYLRSLRLKRAIPDPLGIAKTLGQIGKLLFEEGDHLRARRLCERSLRYRRIHALEDPVGEGNVCETLSRISLAAGHIQEAALFACHAHRRCEGTGSASGTAELLSTIAEAMMPERLKALMAKVDAGQAPLLPGLDE